MNKIKKYDLGIYIFRRDLRIKDNRGLIKLSTYTDNIIPIFIFDPNQVNLTNHTKNYLSFPALKFMCESLKDLDTTIKKTGSKLNIFYGKSDVIIQYIYRILKKQYNNSTSICTFCLGYNEDYTKYSIERDNIIKETCKQNSIHIITNDDDFTLCPMNFLVKEDLTPYKQYGAFKKHMLSHLDKFSKSNYKKIHFVNTKNIFSKSLNINSIDQFWNLHLSNTYTPTEIGGRTNCIQILNTIKKFNQYNDKRDTLSYNTTRLSAHLNFGTISERELYERIVKKLGTDSLLINQIIWRDYYLTLLRFLPGATSYNLHIDDRFNKLNWLNSIDNLNQMSKRNKKSYDEWTIMMNSQTGFLLIDAAIQEIKMTGYMHNRCRLIVGTFAVKYLLINPLCRYVGLHDWFSRHLVDCITSQNKLNCQWITELDFPGKKFAPSTSVIAGRPMNISNLMIKKWDPTTEYIKKWLPHLIHIENSQLYNWDTKYDKSLHPAPIFNRQQRYLEWINLCKNKL